MAALRRKAARADDVQTELDDLQRKYRMMEVNRKSHNEDSQNTVRLQRQQIEKLKKDNERLKEDLALETRQARHANNLTASAQIAQLHDQSDVYARKIQAEKRRIQELDKQIAKMQRTILEQRKEMGGINASKENNQQVQKQIRILENRLDKALIKFNEALAHNKQLRETIDNLRRERVVFDGIYKKLERELHEKKNKMAEIIEISNAAYEARDAAQAEMLALKTQADREQSAFEEKWAQLGQLIERDRKLKDVAQLKESQRGAGGAASGAAGAGDAGGVAAGGGSAIEAEGSAGGAAGMVGLASPTAEDSALEEEQKLRKRVTKGAMGIVKDKMNIHLAMEKVQSYEEAFAKIQQATGISDIDLLVQAFITAEDHNFALFNHVNDLSREIETLEESMADIQKEIERYRGEGVTHDSQRKQILEDLEQQLRTAENKAQAYEAKHAAAMETLTALKSGIQGIFNKIGCSGTVEAELLGTAGVTESNMMQYLGLIEQRTNELLHVYQDQQAELNELAVAANAANAAAATPSAIALPSSELNGDESDEEPITVEEMNRLTKQGSGELLAAAEDDDTKQGEEEHKE